jgi:hypothetical protein
VPGWRLSGARRSALQGGPYVSPSSQTSHNQPCRRRRLPSAERAPACMYLDRPAKPLLRPTGSLSNSRLVRLTSGPSFRELRTLSDTMCAPASVVTTARSAARHVAHVRPCAHYLGCAGLSTHRSGRLKPTSRTPFFEPASLRLAAGRPRSKRATFLERSIMVALPLTCY